MSNTPTISVIIPTLNEAANLPFVLTKVPTTCEVILVDGHSIDGTVQVARQIRPDVVVVHQTRRGKGNALACGFEASTGDVIVMLDADGSADPAEVDRFVEALVGGADFAKGSRCVTGGGSNDLTRVRRAGNKALSTLVNLLFRCRYTDLCYGYNAFWRHCLTAIDVRPGPADSVSRWGDGFEIETLINIRVAMARLQVAEVPSFEHSRLHGVSNLNAVSDGIRVLRTIVRERRQAKPRRFGRRRWAGTTSTPGAVHSGQAVQAVPVQRAQPTRPALAVTLPGKRDPRRGVGTSPVGDADSKAERLVEFESTRPSDSRD